MCIVSAVTGYGRDNLWPVPWTIPESDYPAARKIVDMIRIAKELDREKSQPDCISDENEQWRTDLEQRVEQLEKEIELRKKIQCLETELAELKSGPQLLTE
ncbi:hypothetical protein [Caulobacter phage Cr30]|uniref:hypothetical protein n=1 Tax=Caulobacter phage Cr30 TaxID=1357714 RepID=UPI0004A9B728|nr:hypothetical protein OZ74_gp137 [Caulobacter phage Cr30]AGS81022.1 hypothetical protein [Caulobacter phage Cr30]